jgi:hypothetical protein
MGGLKLRVPQNNSFLIDNTEFWMIFGFPHFRKETNPPEQQINNIEHEPKVQPQSIRTWPTSVQGFPKQIPWSERTHGGTDVLLKRFPGFHEISWWFYQ